MTPPIIKHQTGFAKLIDLPCLTLQCEQASAVVSLYGGHVLSYQPTPDNELLWLSENAKWHNGSAIRGGVPICWPWFGLLDSKLNPEQQPYPNHGLVRNRLWKLTDSKVTAQTACVTLTIVVCDIPTALWPVGIQPQPVRLSLTLILSASQLSMQLTCDTPLLQQAALHSYFRINCLEHTMVTGLSQHYFDKVTNTEQHSTDKTTYFRAETDRIYFKTGSRLQLNNDKNQLTIRQHGHDASVVWNPWQQKSRDLPDMANHGFTEFVCVETARLDLSMSADLCLIQTLVQD